MTSSGPFLGAHSTSSALSLLSHYVQLPLFIEVVYWWLLGNATDLSRPTVQGTTAAASPTLQDPLPQILRHGLALPRPRPPPPPPPSDRPPPLPCPSAPASVCSTSWLPSVSGRACSSLTHGIVSEAQSAAITLGLPPQASLGLPRRRLPPLRPHLMTGPTVQAPVLCHTSLSHVSVSISLCS